MMSNLEMQCSQIQITGRIVPALCHRISRNGTLRDILGYGTGRCRDCTDRNVTVMQMSGSDLVGLLTLDCQPYTRFKQVFCPVTAFTLNLMIHFY